MRTGLILVSIFFPAVLYCQEKQITAAEFQRELSGVQKQFSAFNSAISYTRELAVEGQEPSRESGVFTRGSGLDYRLEQTGILIIQNRTGKFIVDSLQRTVAVTIVDSLFSMNTPNLTDENVSGMYLLSKSVSAKAASYKMLPKTEGAEAAELIVPLKGGFPVTMTVKLPLGNYVSESLNDESLEEPVLTITYTSVKAVKPAASVFSFDKYISTTDGAASLKGFPSDYIFHDLRPNTAK